MKLRNGAKLMDRPERDAEGNPTGKMRGRPTYDVMMTPEAYASAADAETGDNPLAAYLHSPVYIDDCWAGLDDYDPRETTIYLRFTTEQECRAKLAKWIVPEEPA